MEFLLGYAEFLLKTTTLLIAFLIGLAGFLALTLKSKKEDGALHIDKINDRYQSFSDTVSDATDTKKQKKHKKKQRKADKKQNEKEKRVFVIDFDGDMRASAVDAFREEVTAILTSANAEQDEVVIRLESPGGVVHGYGLAASQLQRIRDKKLKLTVIIDKVAASGGYLMACVADQVIAAPFAIIGSIGVVTQLPNFNKLLKKHDIDYEQITAGDHKRTLTLFGENTEEAREKLQSEIQVIHDQFKHYVARFRPQLDINAVATGEHWLAERALELNLVDNLQTSDDYLLDKSKDHALYQIRYSLPKKLSKKLLEGMRSVLGLY